MELHTIVGVGHHKPVAAVEVHHNLMAAVEVHHNLMAELVVGLHIPEAVEVVELHIPMAGQVVVLHIPEATELHSYITAVVEAVDIA